MSREECKAQVARAEARVKKLQQSPTERLFTVVYIGFAILSISIYIIKTILLALGVVETVASPLNTMVITFCILIGGAIVAYRALNRFTAKQELKKAQQYMAQYKHVKPMLPTSGSNASSGGFSNYRKIENGLTGQLIAQRQKDANTLAAEQGKTSDNKVSPVKTNMKRGSR